MEIGAIVERAPVLKKDWVLTPEAFKLLLVCLDPDSARAAQKYEDIRRGLITFFECRGDSSPEDHADETIDRVARRLSEGKEIYVENPASYFYGVARNVLKEHWDRAHAAPRSLESSVVSVGTSPEAPEQLERRMHEQRLEYLEHCLGQLSSSDRQLICEYYQGTAGVKIRQRRLLAEKLGIAVNALRIRALRVREKLEECVARHETSSRNSHLGEK